MKKSGFSLAEILLTLGIIGIVSAITVPTLVSNNQNKVFASKLSVTKSSVEDAFTTMIAAEGVDDFVDTEFYAKFEEDPTSVETMDFLKRNLKVNIRGDLDQFYDGGVVFRNIDGDNASIETTGDIVYQLKNGALLLLTGEDFIDRRDHFGITSLGTYTTGMTCFIDINGVQGPNIHGRDVFRFMVGGNGKLYPAGGEEWGQIYLRGGGVRVPTYVNSNFDYACTDENKTIGCTARLIENNYDVDY